MRDVTTTNFGLLIAYVIPGFVTLLGVSAVSPEVRTLLVVRPADQPTVGGFLYLTVASVGAGVFISTIRWMLIDTLHHATGLRRTKWDFSRFHETGQGYARLNDLHYFYYLFHANGQIAFGFAYLTRRLTTNGQAGMSAATDVAAIAVMVVLYLGSRDTMRRYYERLDQLLGGIRPDTLLPADPPNTTEDAS